MLERATQAKDAPAVDKITSMLEEQKSNAGQALPDLAPGSNNVNPPPPGGWPTESSVTAGALPKPSTEAEIDRGLSERQTSNTGGALSPLRKPTPDQPWNKEEYAEAGKRQQQRENELAQSQYESDMKLAEDPANRPSRTEMNEFISSNTNTRYGASMVNSMGQQMVRDPKTGKVRWTAMSPEAMERIDKAGSTIGGAIGVLAGGSTRLFGAGLENAEAEIMQRNNFQQFLLTSDNGLPESEQNRIKAALAERYGKDHEYAKNPGLAPSDTVLALIKANPDYEQEFDRIKGDEWGEERKEYFGRGLSKVATSLRNAVPLINKDNAVNPLGADDPGGSMTGREAFQPEVRDPQSGEVLVPGIQYDEDQAAPAFPGASSDLNKWLSEAETSPSLYEHFILPMTGKFTGKTPGQIATEFSENIRKKFTDEEQETEREYPLLNPDKEITLKSFFESDTYTHPETKAANPESILLMGLEQLPEMAATIALTRGTGSWAARNVAKGRYGQTVESMNKAREVAAGRAGMLTGGASEGLLVATHLERETREIMTMIPQDAWDKNAMYQALTEGGLTGEAAKQIIVQEASSRAATTAAVVTIITGAPLNRFAARSAAGRLVEKSPAARRTIGALGEPVQEGGQEIMELLQTEAAVRPIDPDNPIFNDPNRYWDTGLSAAVSVGPLGLYSAMSPSTPEGINPEHADAARAASKFKIATNKRFKYEAMITDPDHIAKTTPLDRMKELQKLETLQKAESQAVIDAEAPMRAFLMKQGPTQAAEAELKMLNRLVMRANAMKTDIAVAESKRTTAIELQEAERQVLSDRADLQRRVNESVIKLEDIERMTGAIEAVQNMGDIPADQEAELIREGYAKQNKQGELIILPKGKRATKELNRQARGLRSRIEGNYTGPERRASTGSVRREAVEAGSPQQREELLYSDPLTETQNRRAFNERQEHIDAKEGDTPNQIDSPMPAVASVDIDSLKWVNDNMTHAAGDRLITAVSEAIESQQGVEVYRMGGDEFAVTGASQEQLETALQSAAKQLEGTPIIAGNDEVTPQITWGKGDNYEQADAQAIDMKRERVQRGVTADRKGRPATYKVRSQQGLFQQNQGKEESDVLQRARQGDPDAQATLKKFGLGWDGNKTKYRVVGKAEVDSVLAGDTVNSNRQDSGVTDITDNPDYGKVRLNSDHRITFKQSDKFDTDLKGSKLRDKNKKAGEYHLTGGYDLSDVQKIEQRQEDGTWKEVYAAKPEEATETGVMALDSSPALPSSWNQIRNRVKKGDIVEVLTPEGATFGLVRSMSRNRGKPRLYVSVQGRIFKFNPERNWLIIDKFLDPADLAWITGDAEYAQPGRDTFPQTLIDVGIGHVGNSNGDWYADLDQEFEYGDSTPLPWYMNENYSPQQVPFTPELKPASVEDYMKATLASESLKAKYPNYPPINLVRDMKQLELDAPDVVAQIKAELGGGSLGGVRGYMDHLNPQNGIYVFVQNLSSSNFDQELTEVLVHEMVGHYGVRGSFGDELEMRVHMSDLVDAFPRLADYYANRLTSSAGVGLDKKIPEHKQLIGEEMVAYLAGEVESGQLVLNKKQKSAWRRFLDYIKGLFSRRVPVRSIQSVKEEFWNDERVQSILQRSVEYLRSDKDFRWKAAGGSTLQTPFMRNANIFTLRIRSGIDTAKLKLSNGERKRRAKAQNVEFDSIPEEVPMFPERGTPGQWKAAIQLASKPINDGGLGLSKLELDLTGLSSTSEWQFLRDTTYADLQGLWADGINNGVIDRFWYRGVMPGPLANELDGIYKAMDQQYMSGPMVEFSDEGARPVFNKTSVELMRTRIQEILLQKMDQKKTNISKDLMRAHLASEQSFDVYVEQSGSGYGRGINYEQAMERVFGVLSPDEIDNLTKEEQEQIKQEQRRTEALGYDIGYDEKQNRWFDFYNGSKQYSEFSPQGTRDDGDFRVVLIKTKGRKGEMTSKNQHYGPNIMHVRTGVSELLSDIELSGVTFPNPAMQNKFLSLIELQSDHFQHLRKSFSSSDEKAIADKRYTQLTNILHSVSTKFGNKVAADLNKGIESLLLPIANASDGTRGTEERKGSLWGNIQKRSQESFQRPWDGLSQEEKLAVWRAEKDVQMDDVSQQLTSLNLSLQEYRDEKISKMRQVGGTLDARGFQRLDGVLANDFLDAAISDINIAMNTVASLKRVNYQSDFVRLLNDRDKMNYISGTFRRSRGQNYRLSQATYMLEKPLGDIYELLTGSRGDAIDALSSTQARESATIRLPKSEIQNYIHARVSTPDDEAVGEIAKAIFASSNLLDVGVNPDSMSFTVSLDGEYVDIDMVGDKADVNKIKDAIPALVKAFVDRMGQRQRDSNIEKLVRAARRNGSPTNRINGYDYNFLVDYLTLEEADTSGEGDRLARDHSIQTFDDFSEDTRSDIEEEELDEAEANLDWDTVEDGNLSRSSEEYRNLIVVDEDGQADTDAAEDWLMEQRREYRWETLAGEVSDSVWARLQEAWDAQGPSALVIGSLPYKWDEDGDAVDHVQVRIEATNAGDAYDVFIDEDERDYFTSLDDAKNALDEIINNWYGEMIEAGAQIPPTGGPYGKDSNTNEVADASAEETSRLQAAAAPNWEVISSGIADSASMISGKAQQVSPMFNEMVTTHKKLESFELIPDHPLSSDNVWRPIALKYLISDAVRRGLGGIVWNQGLASGTRGGLVYEGSYVGDMSDVTPVERFVWTKEEMDIRGKTQEVFVIRSPDLKAPMVVARDKMIPILGVDATNQINLQDKGKISIPDLPDRISDNAEVDPKSLYVISTEEDGVTQAVHRRADNEFIGFATNEERLAAMIEQDQKNYGNQAANREVMARETSNPTPVGNVILSQGVVRAEDTGGDLFIITGREFNSYSHTFATPKMAGARQSYEDMMVRIWNKELKKYGTYIQETYVKISDPDAAYRREGQPALIDVDKRNKRLEEDHGLIEVKEFTGGHHGWGIISQKEGPVKPDIYSSKEHANQVLKEWLEQNYPIDRRGVKVFFIPITDQMREEFVGPVAPFAYNPDKDPALKEFRSNIDRGRKKNMLQRFSEWRARTNSAELQQGHLDKFYGLREALLSAELTLDPYIDARLTTSLDSMMKGVIEYGWPVWKEGIVQNEGMSMAEVFGPIMHDPDLWGDFMVGNRAKRLLMEGWNAMVENSTGDVKTQVKTGYRVEEIRNVLPMFSGETEYERVWDMLVKWDKNELQSVVGAVRYDSFTKKDLEGLSENERQYLMRALASTHWRKKSGKVRKKTVERSQLAGLQETKAYSDSEFGDRWKIFDWRVANRQTSSSRKNSPKWYPGQRQNAVDSKWDYTIAEMIDHFGFANKAEARAAANKLTDLALKKQEEHDIAMKALNDNKKNASAIMHIFGIVEEITEEGREKTFRPSGIDAAIRLGDKYPHLKTVAENWAIFNSKVLDFAESMGTINAETRPLWEQPDYVPFLRIVDDRAIGGMNPNSGIANQKSPIRRLKGKQGPIGDPLGNIFMSVTNLVDSAVKNNASRAAVDALLGSGQVIKAKYDWKANWIPPSELKKLFSDAGIPLKNVPDAMFNGMRKMFAPEAPKGRGYFSVMRDGKPEYYYTNNDLLYRSMTNINIERLDKLFPWIGALTGPKRVFTDFITIDPGFVARNVIRDTSNAFVISRDWVVPIGGAINGFREALVDSKTMKILTGAGAAFENGYLTQGDPDATKRLLQRVTKDKDIATTVLDSPYKLYRAWRHITSASENANRIAIYHAAIRAGKSKKQAVFESKDSMDFSMGGDYTHIRFLVATVPFMNARAQGLYRLTKAANEDPVGFAIRGTIVGLAGWVLFMQFRDDERYKELQMWDKQAYHHYWIGEDHYRLPKAFEVGAIFNTIPEMFTEAYLSNASDAEVELLRGFAHMLGQTFSMNPVPQTFMPIGEMMFNYDTFRHRPIVSYYEGKRLPPEQYNYRTSPTMIELARILPKGMDTLGMGKLRSPKHLEHLWNGYLGTLGKYLLMGADSIVRSQMDYPLPPTWEDQDVPVLGSFDRGPNPARNTRYEADVYRLLDKVTAVQGSARFLETTKQRERYLATNEEEMPYIKIAGSLENYREAIQDINKAIMQISIYKPSAEDVASGNVQYTPQQKQERIDELEIRRNELFKEAYKLRPGGERNKSDDPATLDEVIDLIDKFGVDDSRAYQMRLQEKGPQTAELLRMIDEDLSVAGLSSLAKAGTNE